MAEEELTPKKVFAKGGGKESLYRVTIRSQIRLIGIMDSKANLIVSMNTLLITGVIGFLTGSMFYWQEAEGMSMINKIPFLVFLGFALPSMAFAIFSTRTDLSIKNIMVMESPIQFTLSHRTKTSIKEYLAYMENVISSNELIYKNLNLDLYFLSRVVSRKSRFLNISYSLFLMGIVCTVVLFIALTVY